jgi:hypothetical protein
VLRLTGPWLDASRLFLLRLFQGGFEFGREFEFVFQEIIERAPELRELSLGKMVQLGFDLLDFAHASNCGPGAVSFKADRTMGKKLKR